MENTNNKNTQHFKETLEYYLKEVSDYQEVLGEKKLSQYEIEWNSREIVMANMKADTIKQILIEMEDLEINDYNLNKFILNKIRHLIQAQMSYRPTSTCIWKNAVSVTQNEAISVILKMIERHIKF